MFSILSIRSGFQYTHLALLLSYLALVVATPLQKRGSNLGYESSTATVQWTSNNGQTNNMRNYHIRSNGVIIESRRTNVDSTWRSAPINGSTPVYANPNGGGLAATVVKRSEATDDVEIRLFYQSKNSIGHDEQGNARYPMRAIYSIFPGAWGTDFSFNDQVGYVAWPASAITWKDSNGIQQYRVYFSSCKFSDYFSWPKAAIILASILSGGDADDPYTTTRQNYIYEAMLSSTPNTAWSLGNGANPIAYGGAQDLSWPGSISAVTWNGASRVSVFYWNVNDDLSSPGVVKEVRWKTGVGWADQPQPNVDFKDFPSKGALSAISWVDASGVSQIRLYVRWTSQRGGDINWPRLVEFSADLNGWSRQKDLPSTLLQYDIDRKEHYNGEEPPIDTIVWTYPTPSDVHIRLYRVRKGDSGQRYTHEIVYDSNGGWKDGADIDA